MRGDVWIVLAALALTGCDFIYGVRRFEELPTLPDLACVESVVRAAPCVEDVKYEREDGGRPLTLTGIQRPTEVYSFIYRGPKSNVLGVLQLVRDYDDKVRFDQTYLTMNFFPDPAIVAATRPVMRQIELALARECGLEELPAAIQEECSHAECPPLARR